MKNADSSETLVMLTEILSRVAMACALAIGVSVCLGWIFNIAALQDPLDNSAPSAASSGLVVILAALSLICKHCLAHKPYASLASRMLGLAVVLIGFLVLGHYLRIVAFDLDQCFHQAPLAQSWKSAPQRMAPNTALAVLLIGMALVLGDIKLFARYRPSRILAMCVLLISGVSIVGHAYKEAAFYDIGLLSMTLASAIVLWLLAACIILLPPDEGIAAVLTSASEGGILTRRLMPYAIGLPVFLGYLCLSGYRAGLYDENMAVSLLVIAMGLSLVVLIWRTAISLNEAGAKRRRSEEQIKQLNEELTTARDLALESARLKSEFLANMSHEIRTPMNAVIGMSDLLSRTKLDAQQKRFVGIIQSSGESLLDIIEDILVLSKIEAQKIQIQNSEFELAKLVESTLDLLADKAGAKNLELVSFISPSLPAGMIGDAKHVKQVLLNLISNAVKFTATGQVLVSVREQSIAADEVMVHFEVTDTGIGMSEAAIDRLFEPFSQADGSISRLYGGTGLGLAISKRLVELMGGTIGVSSKEDVGSTFWFAVPMRSNVPLNPESCLTTEGRQLRIGIINASDQEFAILQRYLSYWGINCLAVGDLSSFANWIADGNDCANLDIAIVSLCNMAMNSDQLHALAQELLALDVKHLVALVALDEFGGGPAAVESGFSAYLTKPLKQSQLYDCIINLIAKGLPAQMQAQGSPLHQTVESNAVAKDASFMLPDYSDRSTTVLVVEDNPVNQEVIVQQLAALKIKSHIAGSGLEALEVLHALDCSMILMDCHMPKMDGFECARQIRQSETDAAKRIPIIALSADVLETSRDRCLQAGMDDYLTKPVTTKKLADVIRKYLGAPVARVQSSAGLPGDKGTNSGAATGVKEDQLLQLVNGYGSEAALRLLALFLSSVPKLLDRIKAAIQANEPAALKAASHELKGACAMLQFGELQDSALRLELMSQREVISWTDAEAAFISLERNFHSSAATATGFMRQMEAKMEQHI